MAREPGPRGRAVKLALTIAGSDSGGGAGIQADLRTFAAHGVHGASAITAVTAQNTVAVVDYVTLEPRMVVAQIDAVASDIPVAAVKTGMLATAAIVEAVAEAVARLGLPHLVVDPVMVAKSGDRLLDPAAESAYRERLFPLAEVDRTRPRRRPVGRRVQPGGDGLGRPGAARAGRCGGQGGHLEGEPVTCSSTAPDGGCGPRASRCEHARHRLHALRRHRGFGSRPRAAGGGAGPRATPPRPSAPTRLAGRGPRRPPPSPDPARPPGREAGSVSLPRRHRCGRSAADRDLHRGAAFVPSARTAST